MSPSLDSPEKVPVILAVDDCQVTLKVLQKALGTDYQVRGVRSATEALDIIFEEEVNLFLLDVSMPEIDGLELCRTLRQLPQFQQLPIVMLTARDGTFDRVQGKIAGATAYLTKPIEIEELRQTIERFIVR